MNYQEFVNEYTKLYKLFRSSEPDVDKMEDIFDLLCYLSLSKFKDACIRIKESEDDLPKNIVSYVRKHIDFQDQHRARGGGYKHPDEDCSACLDGWVSVRRKTRDGDKYDAVAYCQCPKGQYLKQRENQDDHIATATNQECQQASQVLSGVESTEAPF